MGTGPGLKKSALDCSAHLKCQSLSTRLRWLLGSDDPRLRLQQPPGPQTDLPDSDAAAAEVRLRAEEMTSGDLLEKHS